MRQAAAPPESALDSDRLRHRLARERKAREAAERLLEDRAAELQETYRDLEIASVELRAQLEELKNEREKAEQSARADSVTGLLNRSAFVLDARQRLGGILRGPTPAAVFSIDLDRFKQVNDTYGHLAGDVALQVAARRLRDLFGPEAVFARFGGDEFVCLRRVQGGAQEAAELATVAAALLDEPIDFEGVALKVGASVGVALAPLHAKDVGRLLRFADLALYDAKRRGGGGVRLFEPELYEMVLIRRDLRRRLERGIAQGEIEAWFQPIIDARRPWRRKLEVLARWRDPGRGIVPPDLFVPVAEEAGMIGQLDEAVLRAAEAPLSEWFASGTVEAASCNVSMSEFQTVCFAERFLENVRELGVPRSKIIAEITETVAVNDPDLARTHIEDLANAGVRVALDDFGAGYSNLKALVELPVHSLKFDRSLLQEVVSDQRSGAFFKGAVQMARTLGVGIVAEGIETRRQAAIARLAGCDDLQGFLFSRPMPPSECADWLAERDDTAPFLSGSLRSVRGPSR